jgi:hypothetical protein
MGKLSDRKVRVNQVNELIKYIGNIDRRFFYYKEKDRYAKILINYRGSLWWKDHYNDKPVFLHQKNWESSRDISVGSTLKSLINAFKNYIMNERQIRYHLGPWPGQPKLWGYDEKNMVLIRRKAVLLGIHKWEPEDLNFTDTIEITPKMLEQLTDTVLKDSVIQLRRYNEKKYMVTISNTKV